MSAAICWHRLSSVVPIVFIACLISGAVGVFITSPKNAIGLVGDKIILECAADNTIIWHDNKKDGRSITDSGCSSTVKYITTTGSDTNCSVIVHGTSELPSDLSGLYRCNSDGDAAAIVVIVDPKPTCGVTTRGPILQGQRVTLSCSMTYYHHQTTASVNASIDWESAAGTVISSNSTTHDSPSGTLQTDVWTIASGTEIPSYNCTLNLDFYNFQRTDAATNDVLWTCVSQPVLVWYCPTMVNITPAAGASFKEGDELTCMSDGHPQPSYTWSHFNGTIVSTANTTTLPAGFFHLTCTATGNFTTPCSTNRTVQGFACPASLMVDPMPNPEIMANTTLTCSSSVTSPSVSFHWLNGSDEIWGDEIIVLAEGPFFLTCVANFSVVSDCVLHLNVSGVAVQNFTPPAIETTTVATTAMAATTISGDANVSVTSSSVSTAEPQSATTADGTDTTTSTSPSIYFTLTIAFGILCGLALIWTCLLIYYLPSLMRNPQVGRKKPVGARRNRYRNRSYPPVRGQGPFSPYSNVYAQGYFSPYP